MRFLPNLNALVRLGVLAWGAFFLMLGTTLSAQQNDRIAREIAGRQEAIAKTPVIRLLERQEGVSVRTLGLTETVTEASFLKVAQAPLRRVLETAPAHLQIQLSPYAGEDWTLQLYRADVVTESFRVILGSDPTNSSAYEPGKYYWGIVKDRPNTLVAFAITGNEVMGFVQTPDAHFTIGLLEGRKDGLHIIYDTEDLIAKRPVGCDVDQSMDVFGSKAPEEGDSRAGKCVRMYVEIDNDIVVGKGGVTNATNYVLGAFSQVAIMYANESIDFTVNEIKAWDTADPYTGTNTSDLLVQFRTYLNGNFNGDLAHLVGYVGSGGIAYLDVLCYKPYGVGYSDINASYSNVPTYSWTIMVLTHEIGHNLGSNHTHACAWDVNGDGVASEMIDGCGPSAGYSEGSCATAGIPSGGGTVMSYCHLTSAGINMNNGFGPLPGNRIRAEVSAAPCLTECAPPVQYDAGISAIAGIDALPCANSSTPKVTLKNFGAVTLTSVTINYQLDAQTAATQSWTGSLAQGATVEVTLPAITYTEGQHTFKAWTTQPNGQTDEVPANNQSSRAFNYIAGYCDCNPATKAIVPNPLVTVGKATTTASISFPAGSKNVVFTIGSLNAVTGGNSSKRFTDRVVVTYVDGNNTTVNYGTFLGNQVSSVNVDIKGFVKKVDISLSNGQATSYSGQLSVSFTEASYCSACVNDADGDGICDETDACPNLDNGLIGKPCDDGLICTTNDTWQEDCSCVGVEVPDCCPTPVTANFNKNPLTHKGFGTFSTAVATLPANSTGAKFTISNINALTGGSTSKRFNDKVTVTYLVPGNPTPITYGVYQGSPGVSTMNVDITGPVASVTVRLENTINTTVTVSVSLTAVTACGGSPQLPEGLVGEGSDAVEVFPNPASSEIFVKASGNAPAQVRLFNALGVMLGEYRTADAAPLRIDLRPLQVGGQLLYLEVRSGNAEPVIRSVVVQD